MPAFAYTAIDGTGKRVSGNLAVRNRAEAYRELESKALVPIHLEAVTDDAATAAGTKSKAKAGIDRSIVTGPVSLTRPLIILFTEELADLLDAGVQLEQALRILHERQTNKAIKQIAATLRDEIREGAKFSGALKKASPSFDELYRNLVAAGEAGGSLGEILRRLATNLKNLYALQRRVTGAMIYPSVLLIGCVVLLFVFSTVLMPRLTDLISKTGQKLSTLTQVLIKFTDFMGAWWWLILIVAVSLALGFRAYIASPAGRLWWDRAKMRLPAFGPVITGRFYAQFCHTMANLVTNGVPLLNSLRLVTRGTTNLHVKGHLESAVEAVGEGSSLAKSLSKSGAFPDGLIDRVAIGEQTGELGKAFTKAAVKYDEDLDIRISRLTSLVPQVVLVGMAIVVGVVAYSIMTTIFGSMSGFRGGGGPR
ncbi:MAG: type II secretion system F family protein [Akkermansiaceae bacterium]|nr:type II secretion system F family protein [Akkermansiaceae bacterium]